MGLSENRLSPNPLVCQYFSMLNLLFGSIHHLQTHPNHTESESTECHAGFDVSSTGMFLPSNSPRRYVVNLISCCIHLLNRSNSNTTMFVSKSQNPEDPNRGWSCLVQTTTPAAPGLNVILTNASLPAGWLCLKRIHVEIWKWTCTGNASLGCRSSFHLPEIISADSI